MLKVHRKEVTYDFFFRYVFNYGTWLVKNITTALIVLALASSHGITHECIN